MMTIDEAIGVARKTMFATGDLILDSVNHVMLPRTREFNALAEAYNRLANYALSDAPSEPETIPEAPLSNVFRIHPDTRTPDEEKDEAKERTLDMLDLISDEVEKGRFLDFVIVLGLNEGRQDISGVATMFTTGAIESIPMFMGGLELAKYDLKRVADDQYEDEDED